MCAVPPEMCDEMSGCGVAAGLNQSTVRSARVQQHRAWKAADSSTAQVVDGFRSLQFRQTRPLRWKSPTEAESQT